MKTPYINRQDTQDILDKIKELGHSYLPQWSALEDDAGWAIAQSFAEMNSNLNTQLNQVPQKLFLSYLDTLGFTQSKPLCAKVPITFKLKKKFQNSVLIPQRSELKTEDEITYETDNAFTATSAKLDALFYVDTLKNSIYDVSSHLLTQEKATLFDTTKVGQPQYLYFGDENLFNFHRTIGDTNAYIQYTVGNIETQEWEYWAQDTEAKTQRWLAFDGNAKTLNKIEKFANVKKEINGINTFWIRALLKSPQREQVSDYTVAFKSRCGVDDLYHNTQSLNSETDVYPFGKKPQEHDKFYLSSSEAFSKVDALCGIALKGLECQLQTDGTLRIEDNEDSDYYGSMSVEYFNAKSWKTLTLLEVSLEARLANKNVDIGFKIPMDIHEVNVNGDTNFWIRFSLIDSHFGSYKCISEEVVPDYKYPFFTNLDIYVFGSKKQAQHIIREAHGDYTNLLTSDINEPYLYVDEQSEKTLYLGFNKALSEGLISILFDIEQNNNVDYISQWSYFTQENRWQDLQVKDDTNSLTKNGVCSFSVPQDQKSITKFSKEHYWLRISFIPSLKPSYEPPTKSLDAILLKGIHLNTVMATQSQSIQNKLLGSSNGSAFEKFNIEITPVLEVEVWIIENTPPQNANYYKDEFNEGYWVQWQEVSHFSTSTYNQRVYTVDSHSGTVTFADTRTGRIPPLSRNNIFVNYKIGGGLSGNVDIHKVNKLTSSIAYVDKVTNYLNAVGGADEQSVTSLLQTAPKHIRHRNRTVTINDYIALTQEASSNIAKINVVTEAGFISIIILPYSEVRKPQPSLALKTFIKDYLVARSSATVTIEVKGPQYIALNISLNIIVKDLSLASTLKGTILEKLNNFLHPLNGGVESQGWEFGQAPSLSHIFNLLSNIKGIEYLKSAEIRIGNQILYDLDGQTAITVPKNIMIYNGEHSIDIGLRS
ncbi:MAG: putative baseplate assembly protein [Epsilonproteobacteria bacterium]|nr:MAG: putative baseplate assembly protein [Campylobacterota bacterium]